MNKKYSKIEDPAAPLESGVLSKYRSCAKKCIDDKKVKKDGEAKEIATAILDCSSSVLAMSLLVVGLVAALLFWFIKLKTLLYIYYIIITPE